MRRLIPLAIVAGLSLPAFAQNPPAPPPPPAADKPTKPAAPPADPEAVKAAEAALKESAKAYAQAKALTDTVAFEATAQGTTQNEKMVVAMQGSDKARVEISGMTLIAVKPSLFIVKEGVDDKYAEFAIDSDLASALESQIGFAPPQLVAANSDDVAKLLEAWTFRMLENAKIAGHSMKSDGGAQMHEIALTGDGGEGTIWIDSKTNLVSKSRVHVKPEGAPEGFELNATLTYSPKIADKADSPIAFEPGKRQKVSSLEDLKVDLTGKPAPDFTLEALDGSRVTLSDLKGSVVILDFWATWCGPCKMALPKLSEFTKWAKDNNKSVKVYAVDVWERAKQEEKKKVVGDFWTPLNYNMPTLLDLDDAVAKKYMFDAIPTTIIVDPKGNIFRVHTGFNPDMPDELKKDIDEAMAAGK